jgi:hypothetical protein
VPEATKPAPTRASKVVERIAPHRDPVARLRAHRFRRRPALDRVAGVSA